MTVPVSVGDLKDQVTLLRQTRTIGRGGRAQTEFAVLATVWAKLSETKSYPSGGDGRDDQRTLKVTLRAQTGIENASHILWQDQRYRIASAERSGSYKEWLTFAATARVDAAERDQS